MQEKSLFRFAHISDLHFSRLFFSPLQFLSKRWVGNFNLLVNRKKKFDQEHLYTLIPLFQQLQVDGVLLTGDLTTTSHTAEFEMAKSFIDALGEAGLKVYLIPGNHDQYTRNAYKNRHFYRYFNPVHDHPMSFFTLQKDKVCAIDLGKEWWLLALDSAEPTSLFSSHGVFSEEVQKNMEHALSFIPADSKVIVMNHFPLFEMENKKSLEGAEALRDTLRRFPKVKLYLHGHTHRHIIADLRPSQLPIVVDSGCTAQKRQSSWNLIDITDAGCEIAVYQRPEDASCDNLTRDNWTCQSQLNFTW